MGKSQRTKGAVFEREIAAQFSSALAIPATLPFLPPVTNPDMPVPVTAFKRNIGQARDGGNDIDAGPFVIECKRRKTLKTIEGWLAQATRAAKASPRNVRGLLRHDDSGLVPIVVARADAGRGMVVLDLEDFLRIAGEWVRECR